MITEEKDNEFFINMPYCQNQKCNQKPMTGFFYKFYKQPNFLEGEVLSAFYWTEVFFQCPHCYDKTFLSKDEIDTMNKYSLDRINFPPGTDTKNAKLARLSER